MTTQKQAERRAAFYADLRSGKFTQGYGNLRYRNPTTGILTTAALV